MLTSAPDHQLNNVNPNRRSPVLISSLLPAVVARVKCVPEHAHIEYIPSNARKAIALRLGATYRVYVLLQHINRYSFEGSGKFVISCEKLAQLANTLDITPARVERLIRQMIRDGIFLRPRSRFPYVDLVGRADLSCRLADLALKAGIAEPEEVSYRKEVLEPRDFASLEMFEAAAFNGWLRVNRNGVRRMRWEDLNAFWGRSRPTLNSWIKAAKISKVYNFARVYPSVSAGPCPDDIHVWTRDGAVYWQRANTYVSSGMPHRGRRGLCRNAAAMLWEETLRGISGESIAYIRTNHPCCDVSQKYWLRALKRAYRATQTHSDRTHYLHVKNTWGPHGRVSGQTWECIHMAIDPVTERIIRESKTFTI